MLFDFCFAPLSVNWMPFPWKNCNFWTSITRLSWLSLAGFQDTNEVYRNFSSVRGRFEIQKCCFASASGVRLCCLCSFEQQQASKQAHMCQPPPPTTSSFWAHVFSHLLLIGEHHQCKKVIIHLLQPTSPLSSTYNDPPTPPFSQLKSPIFLQLLAKMMMVVKQVTFLIFLQAKIDFWEDSKQQQHAKNPLQNSHRVLKAKCATKWCFKNHCAQGPICIFLSLTPSTLDM